MKIGRSMLAMIAFAAASGASQGAGTAAASAYAGQQMRDIKSLAAEEIDGYLAGKGMGLAKAAELNGYPGPSHVLAMAAELSLSAEQKQRTEALFQSMESRAKRLGRALVDEERGLDRLFASRSITPEALAQSLRRIGELQAQLRQAHLEAHLVQTQILTPAQTASYMALRGYGDAAGDDAGHVGHRH